MNIETAVEKLKPFTSKVPRDALDFIRENWKQAEPVMLAEMDKMIADPLTSEETALFLYSLFLCAEMRSEPAFARYLALCRLSRPLQNSLLGDITCEKMPEMLARTCGGRIDELKALVEDQVVYDFARDAALRAMYLLFLDGKIPCGELETYCLNLLEHRLERETSYIWDGAVDLALHLNLKIALPMIEKAYDEYWTDDYIQSLESVKQDFAAGGRQFAPPRFSTTEEDMKRFVSQWDETVDEPDPMDLLNKFRKSKSSQTAACWIDAKTGRNEPCPCGSGKKYKKCCLMGGGEKPAAETGEVEPTANEWLAAGYHFFENYLSFPALKCWERFWPEALKIMPVAAKSPDDLELYALFPAAAPAGLCGWMKDVLDLLDDNMTRSASDIRIGLELCRGFMERFPDIGLNDLIRLRQTEAKMLILAGRKDEGGALLESIIERYPDNALAYIALTDILSWQARWFHLLPDWRRAEELLLRARETYNQAEWHIDELLNDLKQR